MVPAHSEKYIVSMSMSYRSHIKSNIAETFPAMTREQGLTTDGLDLFQLNEIRLKIPVKPIWHFERDAHRV